VETAPAALPTLPAPASASLPAPPSPAATPEPPPARSVVSPLRLSPAAEQKPKVKKKKRKQSKNFKASHRKHAAAPPLSAAAAKRLDDASQPSEMILAIKNRAEQEFWQGKRPLAEQMAEQNAHPAGQALQGDGQGGGQGDAMPGSASGLKQVHDSDLAGISFADPPLRMPDSESFARSLNLVVKELKRVCLDYEYLAWPLRQNEQKRVDSIFTDAVEKLRARDFTVMPHAPKSIGKDVSVFTADRFDRHVLGIWSAGDTGLLLLLCTTTQPTPAKPVFKANPQQ